MKRGVRAVVIAGLAVLVVSAGAQRASAQVPPEFAAQPVFSTSGLAAAVFKGGTVNQLASAAYSVDATGVWAQDSSGTYQLLVVGGPTFLNDAFRGRMPANMGTTALTLVRAPGATSTPSAPGLADIQRHVSSALAAQRDNLPRNPNLATQIQAKIAMLEQPELSNEIASAKRWITTTFRSTDGRDVTVNEVYALDDMRPDAQRDVDSIRAAVPIVERFLSTPFPGRSIRIWQGLILGNYNEGGREGVVGLSMEDRISYEGRMIEGMTPYEAILIHELSHSYFGHEALTQFLELYGYNTVKERPADVESWLFARGYVAARPNNTGVLALLDIYELLGTDGMARAYRSLVGMSLPYGQPLPAAAKAAFVDQAPPALRSQVAALADRIDR